jgi:hypothetical protein
LISQANGVFDSRLWDIFICIGLHLSLAWKFMSETYSWKLLLKSIFVPFPAEFLKWFPWKLQGKDFSPEKLCEKSMGQVMITISDTHCLWLIFAVKLAIFFSPIFKIHNVGLRLLQLVLNPSWNKNASVTLTKLRELHPSWRRCKPGVDLMKPFWPKFTEILFKFVNIGFYNLLVVVNGRLLSTIVR